MVHELLGQNRLAVTLVLPTLAIGTIAIEDGSEVRSFVCEAFAVTDAPQITDYKDWRAYRTRG